MTRDLVLNNIAEARGLLDDVAHHWTTTKSPIWWYPSLGILTASRDLKSFWQLSGWLGRAHRIFGFVRHLALRSSGICEGPFDLGVRLPSDAIVLGAFNTRGAVVISSENARVLKWVRSDVVSREKFRNETNALQLGESVAMGQHTPHLYASGAYDAVDWMLTEFIPNRRPFYGANSRVNRHLYLRWMRIHGLPFFAAYYKAAGIDDFEIAEVNDTVGPLASRIDQLRNVVAAPLYRSLIHGDLGPKHVHRQGKRFKVIDWGESRREFVVRDLLGRFWYHPQSGRPGRLDFWQWLSSNSNVVPEEVRLVLDLYDRCDLSAVSSEMLRDQIRLVMLDEIRGRKTSNVDVPKWLQSSDAQRQRYLIDP